MLADVANVSIAGECSDAREAVDAIARLDPDAVLLDVEMPGESGFDVAASLRTRERPYVIFVTAHDRYAIEAFKNNALDYVLKPVSRERLADAIGRARQQRDRGLLVHWAQQVQAAFGSGETTAPHAGTAHLTEFLVRVAMREIVVPVADVDWIEADSYYARLHVGTRTYLLREPLQRLEQRLDARRFVRVHRSAIVNVERVREVRHDARRERVLLMTTGARVPVSRTRWTWFARHLRERTQVSAPRRTNG